MFITRLSGRGTIAVARRALAANREDADEHDAHDEATDMRPIRDAAPRRAAGAEVHAERRDTVQRLQDEPVADHNPRGQRDENRDDDEQNQIAYFLARFQDDVPAAH